MILVRMLHRKNADRTWRNKRRCVCLRADLRPLSLLLFDLIYHGDLEVELKITGLNIAALRRE